MRLETFPPVGGIVDLCRLEEGGGGGVSSSGAAPAEIPETVGVGSLESGEMRSRKEEWGVSEEGRRED